MLFIQVDQDFNIRFRTKTVSLLFQVTPQFAVIEDLAIATQHQRSILIEQRLITRFEIDDPQATRSKARIRLNKVAPGIGAAMN